MKRCFIHRRNEMLSFRTRFVMPESGQKSGNHQIGKAPNENDIFRT